MATRYFSFSELKERGYVSSWADVMRRVRAGTFPSGVKFGPATRRWSEEEIDAHDARLRTEAVAQAISPPEEERKPATGRGRPKGSKDKAPRKKKAAL